MSARDKFHEAVKKGLQKGKYSAIAPVDIQIPDFCDQFTIYWQDYQRSRGSYQSIPECLHKKNNG